MESIRDLTIKRLVIAIISASTLAGCGTSEGRLAAQPTESVAAPVRSSDSARFATNHPQELSLAVTSALAVLDARVGPVKDSSVFIGPSTSIGAVLPDFSDLMTGDDVIVIARSGSFVDNGAHPPVGVALPTGTVALSIADSSGHLVAFSLQKDPATIDRLASVFGEPMSTSSLLKNG